MVSNGNYFKQMLKKYNIRYILLPAQPVNRKVPSTVIKLINLLQKLTLFKTNTAVIDGDLTKMNYKKIYNDGRFVIYEI